MICKQTLCIIRNIEDHDRLVKKWKSAIEANASSALDNENSEESDDEVWETNTSEELTYENEQLSSTG